MPPSGSRCRRGAVSRPRPAAARRAPTPTIVDPGLAGPAAAGRPPRARPPPRRAARVRRDPANPLAALKTTSRADYVYARLEARRAGADDALFLTIDGRLSEATSANVFLVRGDAGARDAGARLRDPARARRGRGSSRWAARRRACARRGLADARRPRRRRRGVPVLERRRHPAGHALRGRADRDGPARRRGRARARADREAFIRRPTGPTTA